MSSTKLRLLVNAFLLVWLTCGGPLAVGARPFDSGEFAQPGIAAVEFITAEALKSKISKGERVTIVDVRSTAGYTTSDNKIKGAIHVKLRKLKSRLAHAPFRNAPRDAEIITYCACPGDESSLRAAEVMLTAGFTRVRVLKGGWQEWIRVAGQMEPRPKLP
jgi:rhodanese-related sulfurtransferase